MLGCGTIMVECSPFSAAVSAVAPYGDCCQLPLLLHIPPWFRRLLVVSAMEALTMIPYSPVSMVCTGGGRVGPIETIFTHVHPPHLCLGHGAMGVPATTMRVTHTLKVVTEAKVAAVICHGDFHPLVHHHPVGPRPCSEKIDRPPSIGCSPKILGR